MGEVVELLEEGVLVVTVVLEGVGEVEILQEQQELEEEVH